MSVLVPSHNLSEMYSHFNEFRLQAKFYDVVIRIGDRLFSCHSIILASALTYFRDMMMSGEEIELNVDAEDFELLLIYIYGGSVSFDENRSYRFLKLCHQLGLPSLESLCINYLLDNASKISFDTVFNIFMFAVSIKNERLVEKFLPIVANNLPTAVENPQFIPISEEYLLKIFSYPIVIENLVAVMDFLTVWIQFQAIEQRIKVLSNLLKVPNLNEVFSRWFLKAIDLQNNAVMPPDVCENNLDEQLIVHNRTVTVENLPTNNSEKKMCDDQSKRRRVPSFLMYVKAHYRDMHFINLYRFQNNEITENMELSLSTKAPASKCFNLYKSLLVGETPYSMIVDKTVNKSDSCKNHYYYRYLPFIVPDFRAHTVLPSYFSNKHIYNGMMDTNSLSAAVSGTNIYVYNDLEFLIFNCHTNQWIEMLEDRLVKTAHSNLVSYDFNLYLVGGENVSFKISQKDHDKVTEFTERNSKIFQRYDEREGKWAPMPNLMYARSRSASCIYNDILYVSGGDNFMNHKGLIECFDFKAFKWFKLESPMPTSNVDHSFMPTSKINHSFFALNNQLWFFGGQKYKRDGYDGQQPVQDMQYYSYDLKEHTWSEVFSVPSIYSIYSVDKILDVVVDFKHN